MTYILCKDTSKNTARKSSSKPTSYLVCLSDEYEMGLEGVLPSLRYVSQSGRLTKLDDFFRNDSKPRSG